MLPITPTPDPDIDAAKRLREELISALTHDLRSPIGAIGIFCEILLTQDNQLTESQLQSIRTIQEAVAKGQYILDDASEISHIYKGTVSIKVEPIDLVQLVRQVQDTVVPYLDGKEVILQVHFPAESTLILSDEARAKAVIIRMLEEAAAYAGRSGKIIMHIECSNDNCELRFSVQTNQDVSSRPVRRPPHDSVKGRLGNRKSGETPYSVTVAAQIMEMMKGKLEVSLEPVFYASIRFRIHI